MDQAPGDPKGYEMAYEEGKRAIAEQAEVLKDTRDRVGTVMSAAAVVAGLGAALAFNNDRAANCPRGAVLPPPSRSPPSRLSPWRR